MRMDKFTTLFQTALADAQSLAVARDHQYIEPTHVMKALLQQEQSTIAPLLEQSGVKLARLLTDMDAAIEALPQVEGTPGQVHLSDELTRLLRMMDKYAEQNKDQYIASELFIPAALAVKGKLKDLLEKAGLNEKKLQ